MNEQKIFFGTNIKFLRERKRLSQETLAEKLTLTRSKLNALENGQTKAPQPEDYINFSNFFKISVDTLLKVNLAQLSELKIRELEAGNDLYMTGSNLRVLAITVDGENHENIEYVPVKAKAGYRSGYADPEFLAALPKFRLPNLPTGHTYRMFPTTGDSMLPIPEGSDILGQYIEDWTSIRPGTPCIVILKGEGDFVFKQVSVLDDGTLYLGSFNTLYEPYTVHASEVLELWKYHSFQSRTLPLTETNMDQIMRVILDVKREVRELRNGQSSDSELAGEG
ncbi:XRE family transcriptional regulator [Arundinibacter roseus]|uniref:Helix-turn-helix domain-containing protein n=1 Tax=Arundinibacter roseus TaxID=2070510 RepID=A0A4R4KHS3_9BACT|nr:helix-turn-helix domain-containing protein [Arundinibacter roseus]TDB67333.1 helix-turn-helix domain-containing protein [Arundinibacter roseus]